MGPACVELARAYWFDPRDPEHRSIERFEQDKSTTRNNHSSTQAGVSDGQPRLKFRLRLDNYPHSFHWQINCSASPHRVHDTEGSVWRATAGRCRDRHLVPPCCPPPALFAAAASPNDAYAPMRSRAQALHRMIRKQTHVQTVQCTERQQGDLRGPSPTAEVHLLPDSCSCAPRCVWF